jgi:hypothetical protein
MRTRAEISREARHFADLMAQLDAHRTRLAEQLAELEAAERVLARFARENEKIRGRGAREVPTQRVGHERVSMPLRLCYDLFEVDRLGQEAKRSPADVGRLVTAIDSLAVVLQTPFFAPDEGTGSADAPALSHRGLAERRERRRQAKAPTYDIDFGAVSAFIDIMSDLVTDETIRSFVAAIARDGADQLFIKFEERNAQRAEFLDDDTGEEALGFLRLVDLSVDISGYLARLKNKAFGEATLTCLKPLYRPEVEQFCLLVQEASRKAIFAVSSAADPKQEEPTVLLGEAMDAKLGTARKLIEQVGSNRVRVRPSETVIRAYGRDVPMLQIAREMERVAGELTRANAESAELGDRSAELEIAQRVLSRFESGGGELSGRGRRVTRRERSARAGRVAPTVSLSDATLQAVRARPGGATSKEVVEYLTREFGVTVRPNHLAIALQRHLRAGRLENINQKWHMPYAAPGYQLGAQEGAA